MIGREAGKMLGTLVAMAVKRMVNLESFIWDMPTGVLSEVFLALASLQDHSPDGSCNLRNVTVRWHNNLVPYGLLPGSLPPIGNEYPLPPESVWTQIGYTLPINFAVAPLGPSAAMDGHLYHNGRVEFPNFSVLPPLRSLAVLAIDEMAYLDEIAVLVAESQSILRELKISIAPRARHLAWFQPWDGPGLVQIDDAARWPGDGAVAKCRLGGVIGVLVGHIFDIRSNEVLAAGTWPARSSASASASESESMPVTSASTTTPTQTPTPTTTTAAATTAATPETTFLRTSDEPRPRPRLDGRLKLEVLGLEGVAMSVHACMSALDWTVMTSITLLQCPYSNALWKALRGIYKPIESMATTKVNCRGRGNTTTPRSLLYQLSLKSIHTDTPSNSLIAFIRDVLKPNSLEEFFLQDRRAKQTRTVSLQSIFNGVIKRHKLGLKRLLIDSSNVPGSPSLWRHWTLTTEMLLYITSGRLKNLRELGIHISIVQWVS